MVDGESFGAEEGVESEPTEELDSVLTAPELVPDEALELEEVVVSEEPEPTDKGPSVELSVSVEPD